MDLSKAEVDVLKKLLNRTIDENVDQWDETQAARIMRMDPLAATLTQHQPWKYNNQTWACTCTNEPKYVSQNHCILTHIRPLVERAATQKVRGILERADMDLDAMLLTDKIFGEQEQKLPHPSEHSMLRRRVEARRAVQYCVHGQDWQQPCDQCGRT